MAQEVGVGGEFIGIYSVLQKALELIPEFVSNILKRQFYCAAPEPETEE